jgi:uncharacterized protein YdeI (YjbR/CyaY-like superfamily)
MAASGICLASSAAYCVFMSSSNKLEVLQFSRARGWVQWLSKNHAKSAGIWLRFYKKHSGIPSLTHAQALEAALCYGWIDGHLKRGDAASWTQKFTPRRPKSIWSKRNRELVEQLTVSKKMNPAGKRAVAAAKADGRWDQAYDSPGKSNVPDDFLHALSKHPKAAAVFAGLNRANIYAITWRLQTARQPATRHNRMAAIIAMLSEGKTFH